MKNRIPRADHQSTGPNEPSPGATPTSSSSVPMHRRIYEELHRQILDGTWKTGDRLPSESQLCERFSASRITVAKAINKLRADRLVSRTPGSGTFVQQPRSQDAALQFGFLVPDFKTTEIFEPIYRGILKSPLAKPHSIMRSQAVLDTEDRTGTATLQCQQLIDQKLDGVFFAPMECAPSQDRTNRYIIAALNHARIPVVLIDRSYEAYPNEAPHDLVGIDNHRAGFTITRHLAKAGARRIIFAGRPDAPSTISARIAGYRDALHMSKLTPPAFGVYREKFSDAAFVKHLLGEAAPDGIVCANDAIAAAAMQTLLSLGLNIPRDIRIIGIDDVPSSKELPVPLTTLRQNCADIGAIAMSTMLERVQWPTTPARQICLPCELIVRESCGAHARFK